jgi:N-glycosyltransferase
VRILLTGLPIRSHLRPVLVPVARAAQAAGHEVAIATGGAIERQGVPVVVLPGVLSPEEAGRRPELRPVPAKLRQWRPEVTGPLTLPPITDLVRRDPAA